MRHPILLLALLLVLFSLPAQASEFPLPREGTYDVVGNETGNTHSYTGHATLKKAGGNYVFEGVFEDTRYLGAGMFDPRTGTLSFCFHGQDPNDQGLSVFQVMGETLRGHWIYLADPEATPGDETWTLRAK